LSANIQIMIIITNTLIGFFWIKVSRLFILIGFVFR